MHTLIIGGNGLIGSSIVQSLEIKKNIIVCDLKKKNNKNNFYDLNINNEKSFKKLFINLNRKKIKVDCVINCSYPRPVKFDKNPLNLSKKNFLDYFETHLWAFNAATREFSEYFKKNNIKGHIINFSSIYGSSLPDFTIYDDFKTFTSFEYFFTKNNITLFTKYYAKYLKKFKIRVNTISPGGVNYKLKKKFVKKYSSKTISKKMLNKDDLNGIVKFLLSADAKHITGQNFIVDDGFTL